MAESRIKPENYITIQGWMVTELGLKNTELIVFACLYGFSQADGAGFVGSISYLAEWANCTRQSVHHAINSLAAKGLITKSYVDTGGICYRTADCKKILHGVKNIDTTCKKSLHNNNSNKDTIKNTIESSSREPTTPPTVEEVADYCRERGNHVDPQRFHDFYTIRKWRGKDGPIEDWRLIVRLWETNGVDDTKTSKQSGFHGGSFDTDDMWAAALEKTYGG